MKKNYLLPKSISISVKKIILSILCVLFFGQYVSAQVDVNATAGTLTGNYTTLKSAFDAINTGTHQGAISISLTGNTTETAEAVLNSGEVAPAVYTSVTITATLPVTVSGSITGAVVKLNGADNVTIDGRIGGVGRNITIQNTINATATAAVWLSSVAAGNGCVNNVIRNLELLTGIDTSAVGSATFGIIMCGTTIAATSNGVDNDNNSFIANRIIKARYGIVTRGTVTPVDLNIATVVTDNIIGPNAFGSDQISKVGIFMQGDSGAIVSRNTVQFVGVVVPQTAGGADRIGIAIGTEIWTTNANTTNTAANYTITKNIIHDIVEEKNFSSLGILLGTTQLGSATNNLVANNMMYNIRSNATAPDQVCGIGIVGGNGDKIVNNSISITGDMDPGSASASTVAGNGIRISSPNGTNNANFLIQNNSIYLDASSSSTPALRFYAISLTSNAYSFGTGGLNYNNYYINPSNPQLQTGGLGVTFGNAQGTEFATLANWQTALTVPQDPNSIQANPNYISPTSDLRISSASANFDTGVTIAAVADDFEGQLRPGGTIYDIGADECVATFNDTTTTECGTYTWGVNGTTYTISGTYNYSIACHTETLNLTIVNAAISGSTSQTINEATAADATIEDIVVTTNGTVTWYASSADASANTNPLPAGTQLVNGTTYYGVTNIGACRSTVLAVTVNVVLGSQSFDISQLNYYPNPVDDVFTIKYNKNISNVSIYDLSGRMIKTIQPNSENIEISLKDLSASVYLVKLKSVDGSQTEIKIVKK